jgi:phosphatidylglycerol:prolipoprotein diacylglycerol transferase
MVALAFLVGTWTASRRGLRDGFASEQIVDLVPWLIVGAIVGARALFVLSYWKDEFADKPLANIFMIWHGGLVYYGGFLGAVLAGIVYVRSKKLPLWKVGDALAPSIALGSAFGRVGCLLNGCCYGRPCSLPWAIRFPTGHETHPVGFPATPVHPTEIYDALLNLCLYAALAWLYRRKRFDGQVFCTYLVCYALLRSFVELFRGDYPPNQHYLGGWATPAQLVSIAILTAGLVLFRMLPRPAVKRG